MKFDFCFCVVIIFLTFFKNSACHHEKSKLSRVRRYLAFPEGSLFTSVFCLTSLMGVTPGSDLFSLNINWGISYDLPNDTAPLLDAYEPAQKRRNRRELYGKVEKVLTSMGYDGRSCVLRSLCEAEQRLFDTDSLGHNILRLIFRFPQEPLLKIEPDIHHTYHYASQIGKNDKNIVQYPEDIIDKCTKTFRCPFSLIDLALGYYSHSFI